MYIARGGLKGWILLRKWVNKITRKKKKKNQAFVPRWTPPYNVVIQCSFEPSKLADYIYSEIVTITKCFFYIIVLFNYSCRLCLGQKREIKADLVETGYNHAILIFFLFHTFNGRIVLLEYNYQLFFTCHWPKVRSCLHNNKTNHNFSCGLWSIQGPLITLKMVVSSSKSGNSWVVQFS